MEELRQCGEHLPLVQLLLVPFKVVQQDSRCGRRDLQITRVATEVQMQLLGYLLKLILKILQRQYAIETYDRSEFPIHDFGTAVPKRTNMVVQDICCRRYVLNSKTTARADNVTSTQAPCTLQHEL